MDCCRLGGDVAGDDRGLARSQGQDADRLGAGDADLVCQFFGGMRDQVCQRDLLAGHELLDDAFFVVEFHGFRRPAPLSQRVAPR